MKVLPRNLVVRLQTATDISGISEDVVAEPDPELHHFALQLNLISIRDENNTRTSVSRFSTAFAEHSCCVQVPPRTAHWYEEFCQASGLRDIRLARNKPPPVSPRAADKWYTHGNNGDGEQLIMPQLLAQECFQVKKHGIVYETSDCPQLWKKHVGKSMSVDVENILEQCYGKRKRNQKKTLLQKAAGTKGQERGNEDYSRLAGKRKPRASKAESSEDVGQLKKGKRTRQRRNVQTTSLPDVPREVKKPTRASVRKPRVSEKSPVQASDSGVYATRNQYPVIEDPLRLVNPINTDIVYNPLPQQSHVYPLMAMVPVFCTPIASLEPSEPLLPLQPSQNPMQRYTDRLGQPPKLATYWGVKPSQTTWTNFDPSEARQRGGMTFIPSYNPAYSTNCETFQRNRHCLPVPAIKDQNPPYFSYGHLVGGNCHLPNVQEYRIKEEPRTELETCLQPGESNHIAVEPTLQMPRFFQTPDSVAVLSEVVSPGRPASSGTQKKPNTPQEPVKKIKGRPKKVPPSSEATVVREPLQKKTRTPRKQRDPIVNTAVETIKTPEETQKRKRLPPSQTDEASYRVKRSVSVLTSVGTSQPMIQSAPPLFVQGSGPEFPGTYRRLMRRDPGSQVFQPVTGYVKVPQQQDLNVEADELVRAWREYVAPEECNMNVPNGQWRRNVLAGGYYRPAETLLGQFGDSLRWHPSIVNNAPSLNATSVMYQQAREFQYRYNQSQSGMEQRTNGMHQSQTCIEQRANGMNQPQSSMEQGANGMNQSQSRIEQRTNGMNQSLSGIEQRANGMNQSQSSMEQRANGMNQSQSSIEQRANGMNQSQSSMEQRANGMHQSQSSIEQRANGMHQSQSGIEQRTNGVHQSQSSMEQRANGMNQSQTCIEQRANGMHQTQSSIEQRANGMNQSREQAQQQRRHLKHQQIFQQLSNECATMIDQRQSVSKTSHVPNILRSHKQKHHSQ